jgi:hypothetical protein
MRSSEFTRDAKAVYACFTEVENGGTTQLVVTKPMKVYIPARFEQHDMAVFENEISFVGICAMCTMDNKYAVSTVTAFMRSEPSLVNSVNIDDVDYVEMTYEPGSLLVANTNLVKIDNLMYRIYDEFFAKGRVPWYLGYQELGKLFEHSSYYAGVTVGSNPAIVEMIAATICRNPLNVKQYYRQSLQSMDELVSNPPTVIPLREVSYGATNATAKLMGPYFDDNVTSTIVSPGERVERVERLLRL